MRRMFAAQIQKLRESWLQSYKRWVADYQRYARMRGFQTFNDWPYHRRGFLECWAEPGFHRFWQVWNPGIAYFVYRAFLRLGGRRRWDLATILAFLVCGFVHTIVVAPFLGRWSNSVIVAFLCFGALTVLSRWLARFLRQERWPTILNILVNVGLVLGSFDLEFRVNDLL
ncbi:MAG: hypothetical protein ACWGSQ_13640 [Longimicrobiales bacterium]